MPLRKEGEIYARLSQKEVVRPKAVDWDLLNELGILEDVMKYLRVLNLTDYAKIEERSYRTLMLEFYSSFVLADGNDFFTCRLKGQELVVDNAVMKAVCGFNFAGTRSKAADFDPLKSWAALSPHTTWDSAGMSNGLIQDLATAVVHRFICYNITGKKEANKVSEGELFLLWAMRSGVRVCSMTFLQNSFQEIALSKRGLPALGHFVTALARHFDVTPEAYRLHGEMALQDKSEMRCINFNELKQADLILTRRIAKEYTKRTAYETYFKKLQQADEYRRGPLTSTSTRLDAGAELSPGDAPAAAAGMVVHFSDSVHRRHPLDPRSL
ncbi:cytidinediphosphate diacylglycerol synthase 2 [Striga asiatica]|uniref:Cytidinediphosphate diacylglycerol synthase 2 n=1 Tax=Striga asiatica TaxID=4170 RepID=A0A5A7R034_STRAF|nr:cytidinediphosphate diacylglycerol synthase 2 [Striga asiatica]